MSICGIIAEFNPLHNGHKYLIDTLKSRGDTVIIALGSNFTQRGETAIVSKTLRTECALKAGADLVCEIPALWTVSTAQNFALGGVWQLYNMGCEKIVFGSESGNTNDILKATEILTCDRFQAEVANYLKSGVTFAAARQTAAENLGVTKGLLQNPNDNLGIEYIIAAKKLNLNIEFECIERKGVLHDSENANGEFASASFIRNLIANKDFEQAKKYIPKECQYIFDGDFSDINRLENAMLFSLRQKKLSDFKKLPDISEGLENALLGAVKTAKSLDELYTMLKSKRYTLARIKRLILTATLEFDKSFFMRPPPYTRVLGFSPLGEKHLKNLVSYTPVVSSFSQIKKLNFDSKNVFGSEAIATDIYALSFEFPQNCGEEYTFKLIKEYKEKQ